MESMKIVGIGEVLWDIFADSEKLGGASFNFAVQASRLGHDVTFISAVGNDERGRAVLSRCRELGLSPDFIQLAEGRETGKVTVRVDAAGQPDFTVHRPAAYDAVCLDPAALHRLAAMKPVWLYFGTLHQAQPASRAETRKLFQALPGASRFYDINLRRNCYTPELVAELLPAAHAVKLNAEEALEIDAMFGWRHGSLSELTKSWMQRFGWKAMAVTRGASGCAIRIGEDYAEPPGYAVKVADTVGAGDAFAAAFLHGLGQGWDAAHCGDFANRLGAVVASKPGGVPEWTLEECRNLKT